MSLHCDFAARHLRGRDLLPHETEANCAERGDCLICCRRCNFPCYFWAVAYTADGSLKVLPVPMSSRAFQMVRKCPTLKLCSAPSCSAEVRVDGKLLSPPNRTSLNQVCHSPDIAPNLKHLATMPTREVLFAVSANPGWCGICISWHANEPCGKKTVQEMQYIRAGGLFVVDLCLSSLLGRGPRDSCEVLDPGIFVLRMLSATSE